MLRKKLYFILLSCLPALIPLSLNAEKAVEIHPKIEKNYAVPFQISLPNHFVLLSQQSDYPGRELLFKFIPQGEDIKNWSEIIILEKSKIKFDIVEFLEFTKNTFDENSDKKSILASKIDLEKRSNLLMSGTYAYAGSFDSPLMKNKHAAGNQSAIFKVAKDKEGNLWSVHYTIKHPKDISPEEHKKHIEKLTQFIQNFKTIEENCYKDNS